MNAIENSADRPPDHHDEQAVASASAGGISWVAAPRIGFARLTKMAFDGVDLRPIWQALMDDVTAGRAQAGALMDLSLIAQLMGEKSVGLSIQEGVLASHRLFLSPCASEQPPLRVLALAAAIDMGGNTPIDFLLEESGFELQTLYVLADQPWPNPLPEHDVAIVVASDSKECVGALAEIARMVPHWPKPLLNLPSNVGNLDRHRLCKLLGDIDGLDIPDTIDVGRAELLTVADGKRALPDVASGTGFPVIVRPRGSHAGVGLAKLDTSADLHAYLGERTEQNFFVSRFVDYSNDDGQFRKYRIAAIDGKYYPGHMAIADRWDIWYLNAGMLFDAAKRAEEAAFMATFDDGFVVRHRHALDEMAKRVGLEYFTVDCAENKAGELLIFEADNTAVIHNMDPPDIYPYKPPQMRAVFVAFAAMLMKHAGNLTMDTRAPAG